MFFSFSQSQFVEQKVEGVKYVAFDSGMICPKENQIKLIDELNTIHEEAIKKILKKTE